jgi:hypothetical protein
MSALGRLEAAGAECAQPRPEPRTTLGDHHEAVGPTGDKDVQDLGKLEQLLADVLRSVTSSQHIDLMGVHAGPSVKEESPTTLHSTASHAYPDSPH